MEPTIDAKEKFDWDRYLESHGLEPVPSFAFQHVEKSQQSLLEPGMMVEVQTRPQPRFWLANVTMKCGPFVRLMHVGQEDQTKELWTDPVSVEIRPVGYSFSHGWPLEPPADLRHIRSSPLVAKMAEEHRATDCEASLLSPAQQMKTGMILELEDKNEPFTVWPVKVVRNIGGRLLLEYLLPAQSNDAEIHHEWLFCLSPRLHWRGWASSQATSWSYNLPLSLRPRYESCVPSLAEEFQVVKGRPWEFDEELPIHKHQVGDTVRVIDPRALFSVSSANLVRVIDEHRVLIDLDGVQLICFPGDILSDQHSQDCPFTSDMLLEAVNPWKQDEICVASVVSVEGSLLRIRLEKDDDKREFFASISGHDLFPVGWADEQNYPLTGPALPSAAAASIQSTDRASRAPNEEEVLDKQASISYWCPKIYFNFRCFTGPLLSRIRVAALPRSVGPGPVSLMMKEVLSLLLNGAYKPGSVLKQLQGEPDDPLPIGTQLEPLKAKYRQTTYRGLVPMASTAADVPAYCKWVCDKLQCCPYLFGPELVGDPCPHRCCILAKAVWQSKKKAPNWRHRRFVDILKAGLDPAVSEPINPTGKGAIESAELSDEDDSDNQDPPTMLLLPPPPPPPREPEEPVIKKKRGRPRKYPLPITSTPTTQRAGDSIGGELVPRVLDVPASPDRWDADEVWRFVRSSECRPLADALRDNDVDGASLLMMTPLDIVDYVTLDYEWALKLHHLVNCLRLTYTRAS